MGIKRKHMKKKIKGIKVIEKQQKKREGESSSIRGSEASPLHDPWVL